MVEKAQKKQLPTWRKANVVTYRQPVPDADAFRANASPSHGAPAPFHARYSHYKRNGFGGEAKVLKY